MTVLLLPVLYPMHRNNFYVACTCLDRAIQIQMDTEFHCFDAEHTVVIYGSVCVCGGGDVYMPQFACGDQRTILSFHHAGPRD